MLLKAGKNWYNGNDKDIYIVQGNAVRDGENAPVNGKEHGKVTVAAMQNQDGTSIFVTVNGWRNRATEVASVRKMDSVFAIGTMSAREYNGKVYYDLDADFLGVSGGRVTFTPPVDVSCSEPFPPADLPLLDDDDAALPFLT